MTNRPDDTRRAPRAARPQRRRAGFTMLEVQVAFILLGIGLAGACPLIAMQSRLSTKVAAGFGQNGLFQPVTPASPAQRTFLVPQPDRWRRKLGASATLSTVMDTVALPPVDLDPGTLNILAPVLRTYGSDPITLQNGSATITFQITRTPPSGGSTQ